MPETLIFTLSARMASFGELAGHSRRSTLTGPTRSAVLGLVAAALGLRRDEAPRLTRLDETRVAVAILRHGSLLRDYHTVQTIPTAKVKRPATRAEALRRVGRDVNTTITERDYLCDVLYGVALWGGVWPLAEIEAVLKAPAFPLYLGRKSCPLSAPLNPKIMDAQTPREAFATLVLPPWEEGDKTPDLVAGAQITSDPVDGLSPDRRMIRHDRAIDRQLWHFAAREVHVFDRKDRV